MRDLTDQEKQTLERAAIKRDEALGEAHRWQCAMELDAEGSKIHPDFIAYTLTGIRMEACARRDHARRAFDRAAASVLRSIL